MSTSELELCQDIRPARDEAREKGGEGVKTYRDIT